MYPTISNTILYNTQSAYEHDWKQLDPIISSLQHSRLEYMRYVTVCSKAGDFEKSIQYGELEESQLQKGWIWKEAHNGNWIGGYSGKYSMW